MSYLYPRIHVVYKGGIYQRVVGRAVGRQSGRAVGANLASRTTSSVFDQFSFGRDVCQCMCKTIFRQWQKECYGNGWQKWGKNLASELLFFTKWNLAEMFALECRSARHIFRQWQKECCHGNGILWQKWYLSRTTSSVFHLLMKFGTDVCLGVYTIFWQW